MIIQKVRKLFTLAVLLAIVSVAQANDGVYFCNGSQLQPLQETDISVKKEVLNISIGDDGFAYVEVDYEFMNNGSAKTVTMGFEAQPPYNDEEPMNKKGIHPHIKDFTVSINGNRQSYQNALVFTKNYMDEWPSELKSRNDTLSFVPVDFSRWDLNDDMPFVLVNRQTKEEANFAYAYYFDAHFKEGINKVRHTYRYRMSYGIGRTFSISYWLTPAMRWANNQIDDFTLRIHADNSTKHFSIICSALDELPFTVVSGTGKTRLLDLTDMTDEDGNMIPHKGTEVVLRNGVLEWHCKNFKTDEELEIESADMLQYKTDMPDTEFMLYYDSGETFNKWGGWWMMYDELYKGPENEKQKEAFTARLRRNLPYAHRGYVFKDAELRRIFESTWWYMPDPTWKPTSTSFSRHEQELIANSDNFADE